MGYIGVSLCDMCGRRTENFAGRLVLSDISKKFHTYTTRSWKVCKRCFNKLSATETVGDKIRQELEVKLDEIRFKRNQPILLTS